MVMLRVGAVGVGVVIGVNVGVVVGDWLVVVGVSVKMGWVLVLELVSE